MNENKLNYADSSSLEYVSEVPSSLEIILADDDFTPEERQAALMCHYHLESKNLEASAKGQAELELPDTLENLSRKITAYLQKDLSGKKGMLRKLSAKEALNSDDVEIYLAALGKIDQVYAQPKLQDVRSVGYYYSLSGLLHRLGVVPAAVVGLGSGSLGYLVSGDLSGFFLIAGCVSGSLSVLSYFSDIVKTGVNYFVISSINERPSLEAKLNYQKALQKHFSQHPVPELDLQVALQYAQRIYQQLENPLTEEEEIRRKRMEWLEGVEEIKQYLEDSMALLLELTEKEQPAKKEQSSELTGVEIIELKEPKKPKSLKWWDEEEE